MLKPAMPYNEQKRLENLLSYNVLDTERVSLYDELTEMGAEICGTPIALISLVDDCRQWFKSAYGLDATETEREISFCGHAILQSSIFEVPDTYDDERFYDNPLVRNEPFIRFYAGVPLISENGYALGTLCVIDQQPRKLTRTQRKHLKVLAGEIAARFELQRKNQWLIETKALQELITETNQDYIIVRDRQCRIVQANHAFRQLFPSEMQSKLIGSSGNTGFDQSAKDKILTAEKEALKTGKLESLDTFLFPDGIVRMVHSVKIRFFDESSRPYVLTVARDVSERERLIESLSRSNKALEEFAHIASHDLRSPLMAIKRLIGWVAEDEENSLSEESRHQLDMVSKRATRMETLLTDLLEYAKVGTKRQQPELVNLRQLTLDCLNLLNKPESFSIEADDQDMTVPKLGLELVLTNLISNAIKHHDKPNGCVSVRCEVTATDYKVTVADDGPGIPEQYHDKIFEKFEKLESTDAVEGTGLGLAMVEKMVTYYGGTISLQSTLGQGSQFLVVWPKPQAQ